MLHFNLLKGRKGKEMTYQDIVKKYPSSQLVTYEDIIYPAECLWLRKQGDSICVEDAFEKFYELPVHVSQNSSQIMKMYKHASVYNQVNIRLDDCTYREADNTLLLKTSRTQFFDSLLTNRACDYLADGSQFTVRKLYEPGPFMKPLRISQMSNHLGFNGFVMMSDTKRIPFIFRKGNLSVAQNIWGAGVSGSLKAKYALSSENGFKMTDLSIALAIIAEIKDELNLQGDSALKLDAVSQGIFTLYRDFVECGKPQLAFLLELCDTTEQKLKTLVLQNCKKNNGVDTTTDGDIVEFFSPDQLRNAKFTLDGMYVDETFYKMHPSTLASLVLLLQYMGEGK